MVSFRSRHRWTPERPRVLVVACSDGRLQEAVDEFLGTELGVQEYDRLYLPGGPGALAGSGMEFVRTDRMRREFRFLLEAHRIQEVVLIFHGPAEDGPEQALCADYRRIIAGATREKVLAEQERDAREVMGRAWGFHPIGIRSYLCEVHGDLAVTFRPFAGPSSVVSSPTG